MAKPEDEEGKRGKKEKQVDTCGGERPENREGEEKLTATPWTLEKVGDKPMAVNFYAGCIKGDRLSLSLFDDSRNIYLKGTAEDIALYAIGEERAVGGQPYRSDIGRDEEEPVDRLRQEVTGEGEAIQEAIRKEGPDAYHDGYTVTVNGQKVTGDSKLNSFFQECVYVVKGENPKPVIVTKQEAEEKGLELYLKKGEPIEFLGGVDITVAAIIVPGADEQADNKYQTLEQKL